MDKLIISLFLLLSINTYSQSNQNNNSKIYNDAVSLSEAGDCEKAVEQFKRVAKLEPDNINALYNIGFCYLNMNNRADSASIYFNKTIEKLNKDQYYSEIGIDAFMSLAKSYQLQYKYQEGIETYNKMNDFIAENDIALKNDIARQIEICNNAIELMKHPVKLEVHNLGENINSKYDDHSPLINADESLMIFTSKRKSSYSTIMDDGQFSEKVYTSTKDSAWSKSEILASLVEKNSHESGVCLSADGTELYMLISNIDGQNLYVSNFDGETWSEPYKLPNGINSRYNETHASINTDKSILFFTSDRKGGYGGLDIYSVRKLPNGEWGTPQNLGDKINTPYDEETPMIGLDNKTLYFSSEGHNSMGNFDIFYSKMAADSSWNTPVNMGYPINTPDDDFFFVPTAAENKAYLASSRFDHNYGGSDIYLIEYEEPFKNKLAVIRGQLKGDEDTNWDNVRIVVKEENTNKLEGEYKPNPETGKYLLILETEKNYDIQFEGLGVTSKSMKYSLEANNAYYKTSHSINMDDVWLAVKSTDQNQNNVADTNKTNSATDINPNEYPYTVQFITLKKVISDLEQFSIDVNNIKIYKCKDGNVRYVFGQYKNFKDAKKAKNEVIKATGYDDPFVRYFWQLNKLKAEE